LDKSLKVVDELYKSGFKAKAERRRELARLPFEDKIGLSRRSERNGRCG
jgi:hypothetical protein